MPLLTSNNKFFTAEYNFAKDNLFAVNTNDGPPPLPPVTGNFLLLDGSEFLLLDLSNFLLL